jgi:copper(I)-binding protein
MLMSLKQPLQGGQSVPLILVFEDERGKRFEQTLVAPVTALGAGNAAMRAAPPTAVRP